MSMMETISRVLFGAPEPESKALTIRQGSAVSSVPLKQSLMLLPEWEVPSPKPAKLTPRFQRKVAFCKLCNGPLTDQNSIASGFGPRCAQIVLTRLQEQGRMG